MTDSILAAFAAELAREPDPSARKRLLARASMIAMQEAPKEAFDVPIKTLGEYLASPIEVPPELVSPYMIVRGGLHATIGRAGKGKTVLNLNRALRWAAGKPLFDGWTDDDGLEYLSPSRPLKILIVENEGAAGMFHRQIGIMLNSTEFLTDEDRELCRENVLIWGEGGYSGLKFDDPRKLDTVRAGVEKHEPDIMFIEPFRSLWQGEENSATEMHVVIDALVGVATDYDCACLISHHERKSGTGEGSTEKMNAARGSSVLEGAVTIMENFEPVGPDEKLRELSWSKSRHSVPPTPVRMEWVANSWWYRWVPDVEVDGVILAALRRNGDEPMNLNGLIAETGEPAGKLRRRLLKLEESGKILALPSVSGASGGSTGRRYRLPLPTDNQSQGGLPI